MVVLSWLVLILLLGWVRCWNNWWILCFGRIVCCCVGLLVWLVNLFGVILVIVVFVMNWWFSCFCGGWGWCIIVGFFRINLWMLLFECFWKSGVLWIWCLNLSVSWWSESIVFSIGKVILFFWSVWWWRKVGIIVIGMVWWMVVMCWVWLFLIIMVMCWC